MRIPPEIIAIIAIGIICAITYPTWHDTYEASKQDDSRKRKNDEE